MNVGAAYFLKVSVHAVSGHHFHGGEPYFFTGQPPECGSDSPNSIWRRRLERRSWCLHTSLTKPDAGDFPASTVRGVSEGSTHFGLLLLGSLALMSQPVRLMGSPWLPELYSRRLAGCERMAVLHKSKRAYAQRLDSGLAGSNKRDKTLFSRMSSLGGL